MDNFFFGASDQIYFRLIKNRAPFDDLAFYRMSYLNSDVTLNTCQRVRRVLCQQLRMCNTLPEDDVAKIFPDIDIGEICCELSEEFGFQYLPAEVSFVEGTVDSLIRWCQNNISQS